MAEYDALDDRVRSLEIWRGEMGSVKGDVHACDLAIHEHREQLRKLERRMEDAEKMDAAFEERVSKNEATTSWLGNWRQRSQGIATTLAALYIGIELLWPGSISRLAKALGAAMSGGQP